MKTIVIAKKYSLKFLMTQLFLGFRINGSNPRYVLDEGISINVTYLSYIITTPFWAIFVSSLEFMETFILRLSGSLLTQKIIYRLMSSFLNRLIWSL